MKISPGLQRHPQEAALIGLMLLSYSELELRIGLCLAAHTGLYDDALRIMFRIFGETSRVRAAAAVMRSAYAHVGLKTQFDMAIGATQHCVTIRNQYAHCHWAEEPTQGLFFTSLDEAAKPTSTFDFWFRHVDMPLLEAQSEYFDFAADFLDYLESEFKVRTGKLKSHGLEVPKVREQPKPHNPPEEHFPIWIAEDAQLRHLERALEQEGNGRQEIAKTTVPAPSSAERLAAAMWRADLKTVRTRLIRLLRLK